MLKGYTLPRSPKGTSSLAPMPPWHYVGNCLAVEYEADPQAVNTRHFPELVAGLHDLPAVYELVQLKSRDVHVSPIWKGEATLQIFDYPYLELPDIRPTKVIAGYRFSCALTVDDLILLRDLRTK